MNYIHSENSKIRIYTAFFGVCIYLSTLLTNGSINNDGILYLQMATTFNEFGWNDKLFDQGMPPFYAISIALIHAVTTFTFENCAHLLNIIFVLLLADAFICSYWQLNTKINYLWMPAVVILAYTGLNNYKPMIIRDWGYWAFLWKALFYFIQAYKYERLKYYILWHIFIILAFLLRSEAIVLILFLPCYLLLTKKSIASLFCLLFLGLFIVILCNFKDQYGHLSRICRFFSIEGIGGMWHQFMQYANVVTSKALSHQFIMSERSIKTNVIPFITSGLVGLIIIQAITKMGVLYAGIVTVGYFRYKRLHNLQYVFINWMIGVSILLLFIYLAFKAHVLSGRYVIQISLFLLLYVTYYCELIWAEIKHTKNILFMGLFIYAFFVNLIIGIHHSS